ncbi:MAG: IclR family transcriptional regulator [Qingshengfaniella sp.]
MTEETGHHSSGLKSLDTALSVLAYMARQPGSLSLSDIARACAMPPSKVHRYLASFVEAGLVKQEGRSGRYDLGVGAMQLGLAALARHDFVNHAADGLPGLARETGMTVLLSVWANQGATVVRWERGLSPTVTSMGLGTTLPLLNSATGRAFLAWAPKLPLQQAYETELRRATRNRALIPDMTLTKAGIAEMIDLTRTRGFAAVEGKFIPGLVAAAAPILDWQAEAQAVITLVGVTPEDVRPGATVIDTLVQFCAARSVTRPAER